MQEAITQRLAGRIVVIMVLIGFSFFILGAQLIRWQALVPTTPAQAAPMRAQEALTPARGNIVDRHGYLLASNTSDWEISAAPKAIAPERRPLVAQQLADLLHKPVAEIQDKLTPDVPYVLIERRAPADVGETILAWDSITVTARPLPRRYYPQGGLAAHLLGFVNETQQGFYGLEGYYQDYLTARSPQLPASDLSITEGDPLPDTPDMQENLPSPANHDLVLTIDRSIQWMIEQELADAVKYYQAESGTIIVMEPRSGAIMGMASYPSYDPNKYGVTDGKLFQDPAVSQQYEPGSVFKIVTMAAGLDTKKITPDTRLEDKGTLMVGAKAIYDWDRLAHGMVTPGEILADSLNIGAAEVSLMMGSDFYDYVRRFGIGQPTGVDLAGEVAGTLKQPGDPNWSQTDLATNAFGQGVAVTSLQMLTAAAAVANDGILMRPHIVERLVQGSHVVSIRPQPMRRVIDNQTARTLTDLLIVAAQGEGAAALVPGYAIAGKTGTAEIPQAGGYNSDLTIASFLGYAPAHDPRFVCLVKLDKPKRSRWANDTAAPVFQRVARRLLTYLNIPPDNVKGN